MSLDPNTLKEKVNIFIASSEEAKHDAQTLSNMITKYPSKRYSLKTTLWWKASSPLLDILDDIINMTHDHDFAIVLLPHLGDSDEDKVDRNQLNYNCLYEAGLFTGALGADKNRVFLVTSEQELPSDLRGIFSYRFKPGDEDSLNAVGDLIAQRICAYEQSAIHPVKGLPRAVINKEELLQRETVSKHGGMLSGSAIVFINSTRPIEADDDEYNKRFITQMTSNVLKHEIEYYYVFERKKTNTTKIARMIGRIFSEAHDMEVQRQGTPLTFEEKMEHLRDRINIFFVEQYPPFEYCVHDADTDNAICYMRCYPPRLPNREIRWVEWRDGKDAERFFNEIERIEVKDEPRGERIFHDSTDCKILLERGSMDEQRRGPSGYNQHGLSDSQQHAIQLSLSDFGKKLYSAVKVYIRGDLANNSEQIIRSCFGTNG